MKWFLSILVFLAAAVALWWSGLLGDMLPPFPLTAPSELTATPVASQEAIDPLGLSDTADTSNEAIAQDGAATEAQLRVLESDLKRVEAVLADKALGDTRVEIDRRVEILNTLATRIEGMRNVTDTFKTALATNVGTQVSGLTTLANDIDVATDDAAKQVAADTTEQAYPVFVLVAAQGWVPAAADQVVTGAGMLTIIGNKLGSRLTQLRDAGANVDEQVTLLTSMGENISSAQTNAQEAVTGIVALTPDNGDAGATKKNSQALKDAYDALTSAWEHLSAARESAGDIIEALATITVPEPTTQSATSTE